MADSVLNNSVISTSIGSEDVSFKATRRNTYEENLFKCEDDRYELDMLIETNASLMRVLEALAAKIASLPPTLAQRGKHRLPLYPCDNATSYLSSVYFHSSISLIYEYLY